jgi:hypothetical protein
VRKGIEAGEGNHFLFKEAAVGMKLGIPDTAAIIVIL